MNIMNDLNEIQEKKKLAKQGTLLEKYESPRVEVIELELEGTILSGSNLSDVSNNEWR